MWEPCKAIKRVEVKAIQFNGINQNEVVELAHDSAEVLASLPNRAFLLLLYDKPMLVELNDWIVKEANGDFDIVKAKEFEKDFEVI